jgi:acetoin utilization deacetylase AcuC-like enzyme
VLVVTSDEHRQHHPSEPVPFAGSLQAPREVPARVDVILDELRRRDLATTTCAAALDEELLARVHDPAYLDFLRGAHQRWCRRTGRDDGEARPFVRPYPDRRFRAPDDVLAELGRYSHDTDPLLAGTWSAATGSVASAVTATAAVLGGAPHAYALCRPPGHHAAAASFGGYCYLNNVAVAAQHAVEAGARVAVLDVDAHAGNGTAHVFWQRDDVLVVSVHVDPRHEYPFFGGRPDEVGEGAGAGFTHHLPVPAGTNWSDYEWVLVQAMRRVVEHRPDLVLVSLGVDTSTADGVLRLDGQDYLRLGERLASLGAPLVLVQEGGYDLEVLGVHVADVLEGIESVAG